MDSRKEIEIDEPVTPETIALKYKAVVVHAIRSEVFESSLCHLLLAENLETSCSTVSAGDSINNIVGAKVNPRRWGVVISGGKINSASPFDVASAVDETRGRSAVFTKINKTVPISRQVEIAITNRPKDFHNEIYVESPKISGIYYFSSNNVLAEPDESMTIVPILEKTKIPLYVINNGLIYPAWIHDESIICEEVPVSPADVVRTRYDAQPEVRDYMIDKLAEKFVPYGQFDYLNYVDRITRAPAEFDKLVKSAKIVAMGLGEIVQKRLEYLRRTFDGTLYRAVEVYALIEELRKHEFEVGEIDLSWVGCLNFTQYHNFVSHLREDGGFKASREEVEDYFKTGKLSFFERDVGPNKKNLDGISPLKQNNLSRDIIDKM